MYVGDYVVSHSYTWSWCVGSHYVLIVFRKPEPFEISIRPRSQRHAETIRKEWARYMETVE